MKHNASYAADPATPSEADQLQEFIHSISYFVSQEAQLQNIQDEVKRAQAAGQVQLARALQDNEDTQTSVEVLAMEDLAARAKLLKASGTLDRCMALLNEATG